jgi:hypothetical protein
VSTGLIRAEIKRGNLEAKHVGRRVLILADSEKAWLNAAPSAN